MYISGKKKATTLREEGGGGGGVIINGAITCGLELCILWDITIGVWLRIYTNQTLIKIMAYQIISKKAYVSSKEHTNVF